jgi:hypothetical protein
VTAELSPEQEYHSIAPVFSVIDEAIAAGFRTKAVLLGPLTLL